VTHQEVHYCIVPIRAYNVPLYVPRTTPVSDGIGYVSTSAAAAAGGGSESAGDIRACSHRCHRFISHFVMRLFHNAASPRRPAVSAASITHPHTHSLDSHSITHPTHSLAARWQGIFVCWCWCSPLCLLAPAATLLLVFQQPVGGAIRALVLVLSLPLTRSRCHFPVFEFLCCSLWAEPFVRWCWRPLVS
jgi:hypothetical protein